MFSDGFVKIRLIKQIKEYKKASIATPLFMLGEVLMETIVPLLMAKIIDNGVNVEGYRVHL